MKIQWNPYNSVFVSLKPMITFDSSEDFLERGFGYCALQGDQIVCVASTFTVSDKGIEIQIDNRKEHRRKGVATIVATYLIVDCLENGIDPSWDAATKISAAFAEKLGYTPQETYQMHVFTGSRALVKLRDVVQWMKPTIEKFRKSIKS